MKKLSIIAFVLVVGLCFVRPPGVNAGHVAYIKGNTVNFDVAFHSGFGDNINRIVFKPDCSRDDNGAHECTCGKDRDKHHKCTRHHNKPCKKIRYLDLTNINLVKINEDPSVREFIEYVESFSHSIKFIPHKSLDNTYDEDGNVIKTEKIVMLEIITR